MEIELTIGEVARRVGLAPSALRFYEAEGLLDASRNAGGQRRYRRDVIRRVSFIKAAQAVGLSLDDVRRALARLPEERTPTAGDWETLASEWQPMLDARIAALVALRDRLSSCIGCGCLSLDTCALYNPADGAAANGPGPRYLLGDDPTAVMEAARFGS